MDKVAVATALIMHCEGCILTPKLGIDGKWSIGFGNRFLTDGTAVSATTAPLDPAQARALLDATLLGSVVPNTCRLFKTPLTDCQIGALISLAWNVGCYRLVNSTLRAEINLGNLAVAAEQFDRFVLCNGRRVHGLVVRRALERGVFLGELDPLAFQPVAVPSTPHPALASTATTKLTADELNARQLALLKPIPTATDGAPA